MPTIKPLRDSAGVKAVLYSGDNRNFNWTLTIKDNAGAVVDITGWTIKAIAKQSISDTDATALMTEITCTIDDGPAGQFTIGLTSATITGEVSDAMMIIWRDYSGQKKILCQYYVDVIDSALD